MRILTVADFFYPEIVGGSAIYAAQVMKELAGRGHEVVVMARDPGPQRRVGEWEGVQIRHYPFAQSAVRYPLTVARSQRSFGALLDRERFDLVNAHHASSGYAIARALKGRGIPFIFFFHGPWHLEALAKEQPTGVAQWLPQYYLRKLADRSILRNSDRVVVLSDYMAGEAGAIWGAAPAKATKIPSGVDLERFSPRHDRAVPRRRLGLPQDQILLLAVRRLDARMGLENLIDAMAIVEGERKDVALLIGGRGPLEGKLAARIAERGLLRTRLLGYVEDGDLADYYGASDLVIMPSVALEGFGLSTLEALASGVPVLGTPTGGTPEILSGVLPDYILEGTAPDQIARGILAKLESARDPAVRGRVRAYAERFAWPRIGDAVEGLFGELGGDGN